MNYKGDKVSIVGILVSVFAGFISLYSQSKDPQTGLLLFLLLLGAIFLFFLASRPIDFLKKRFNNIDKNSKNIELIKKDLNIIKDKLNFRRDMTDLNTRISVIENLFKMKNKKGQIDPRWILILIILFLFYLYMKSKGVKFFF